jgi:hypothetical protein
MNEVANEVIGGKGSGGGGGGGISSWDPVLKPDYIQAGINKAPGTFIVVSGLTQTIDDLPSGLGLNNNPTIFFNTHAITPESPKGRWQIASKKESEDKFTSPPTVATEAELNAIFPTPANYTTKYCFVTATGTYWNGKAVGLGFAWVDTAQGALDTYAKFQIDAKDELRKLKITPITATTKGTASKTVTVQINTQGDTLSLTEQDIAIPSTQVTDFIEASQDAIGGALLDTATIDLTYDDATNKISADVKDLSLTNSKIATNAGIETSKSKQATITPVLATPANNDTQEQINNKLVGLSNNLQSQISSRPIGASNGSVYYLTSQDSAIANYELLSFSPDPSALDIESVTINSTTAKASRLIHSYIANYEIGSAIVNGGNWLFNFYGYVSHLNSSRFEIDVLKRVGVTETLLFTCETTDFLKTSQVSPELNIVNVETTQQDFPCNATDKIVIKIYGKTDRTQDTTITLLHSGTDYASHIHTPLIVTHNNLVGTQGGSATEKYHLTLAEYNKVQVLDTSLAGKVDKVINKSLVLDTEIAKLATIEAGAEVNVQADYAQTDNTQDNFIKNKPALGTVASKNVGTAVGNIQENGAELGASQIVLTDADKKFKTEAKATGYNLPLGTTAGTVVEGGTVYIKSEVDNLLQNIEDKFEIGRRIAKQYSSELYDVTAYLKGLTYTNVSTEAQLLAAILVEGFVVKLTNNITVASQINFAQKGVLHLNGFTINASVPTVVLNITKAVIISGGTLSHEKLTDTSIEVLVKINTPVNERAILHSLTLKHVEFGVDLSGSWALQNVNFEYNTIFGTATDSHRHIVIKTVLGDCFIDNITFSGIPQVATTRYTNFILADITEWTGNLHIRNVKQSAVGALRQFLSFQTLGVNVTAGKLIVQDCNFNDLNGGIFFLTAGALDKMEYIVLTNNEQGGDAIGGFKGLLYFSFTGALGTKAKIIHYNNKTLAGELRSDYVSLIPTADTENAGIVARQSTVTINAGQEYAVANKSIIETFYQDFYRKGENDAALNTKQNITDNTLNTTSKTIVGGINELKTSIDGKVVDAINDGVTNIAPSQNAVFDALALKAPLISPALTGTPTAPTAVVGTNDTQIATTNFVKTEISATVASLDVMVFKGIIDASTNPNYPDGDAGHTYRISVGGKIGGASGINVETGDLVLCLVDGTVSGDQSTVGTKWNISQVNIDGAVVSSETVTADNDFVTFSGTSGKVVKKVTLANYKTLLALSKADVGLNNVPNIDATNPANISQSSTYRFVSDTEKATWNAKEESIVKSGNKYKVVRLNSGETANYYDFAVPSLTTTERDNLATPATGFIIYNSTDDKLQRYSGTAWVNIVAAGTGNVSANSLSGIATGELVLFSSSNGTTITKIDGTASQRRVLSKNSKLIASFTTTERDAILDWQSGEVIYNSTNSFAESYNGTTWIQNYRDTTDFVNWIANGVNAGGTLVGNATWATNLGAGSKNGVQLTSASNNQRGFWYKAIPQIAHKRIVLYADHVSGSGTGADGIFYSIFANTPPTASNEPTAANNSYTILFHEFLDEVSLRYNGVLLQTVPFVGLDSSANDIKQIRIVIDYNPLTNLSRIFAELKGAGFGVGVCIDYNDTVPRNLTGQYVFACGYTVGQNNFHELHHLAIRKFYEY